MPCVGGMFYMVGIWSKRSEIPPCSALLQVLSRTPRTIGPTWGTAMMPAFVGMIHPIMWSLQVLLLHAGRILFILGYSLILVLCVRPGCSNRAVSWWASPDDDQEAALQPVPLKIKNKGAKKKNAVCASQLLSVRPFGWKHCALCLD